jgi:signal transduction histidine kinase
MSSEFSTGSQELDALLEELRAGDNVVFYTWDEEDYLPFIAVLLEYLRASLIDAVYVRSDGLLDTLLVPFPSIRVIDLATLAHSGDPLQALEIEIQRIGPRVYYLFESLDSLAPWLGDEEHLRDFFLTVCPLLFRLDTVAYWNLIKGAHSFPTLAAIKDCTQVFLQVDRLRNDLMMTPVKVWGRYSEAMFRPHHVTADNGRLHVQPLPVATEAQQAYTQALAEKNRELAEIRDALNSSNQQLKQRNDELAELNMRLSEQSRLYQSLRVNLDHFLALFQAGQVIGSSLATEQVRHALVTAALRLFDVSACRLYLPDEEDERVDIAEGIDPTWTPYLSQPATAELRAGVCCLLQARALTVYDAQGALVGSIAIAPISARGVCLGTLEICAPDARLNDDEALTLLSYLASEASIALDNAQLYREVETQGRQLRSFVENVITNEEQDSRRLAFDLHDGLVQLIVASYQHLQTAQAWRRRDPGTEEKEIDQGVQLVRRAIYEARRLISQLRPTGLDDFGLAHALRLYVDQLAADADWQVSLDIDADWAPLPAALEAALFRIVQEATTNARKYAEAPRVQINLQVTPEQLCVRIRDWGKGFSPKEVLTRPQQGLHLGLIGIRERASLWGGKCTIKSQRGKGTTIDVTIPRARVSQAERDSHD